MTKRSLDNEGNSDGKRADSASNNDSEVNENGAVVVAENPSALNPRTSSFTITRNSAFTGFVRRVEKSTQTSPLEVNPLTNDGEVPNPKGDFGGIFLNGGGFGAVGGSSSSERGGFGAVGGSSSNGARGFGGVGGSSSNGNNNDGRDPNPLGGFSAVRNKFGGSGDLGGISSSGASGVRSSNGVEGGSSSYSSNLKNFKAPNGVKRPSYISGEEDTQNTGWSREDLEFVNNLGVEVKSREATPSRQGNLPAEAPLPQTATAAATATPQSPAPAPSSPGADGVGEAKQGPAPS